MQRTLTQVRALAVTVGALWGCGGAGPYGHARGYVALAEEGRWQTQATDPVYDEVRRMPDHYQGQVVSWFGVVTAVQPGAAGEPSRITMQLRTPQQRNLCEDEPDSSCRMTVSQRDGGPFTALVPLRHEDTAGENQVQPNSLLRIYGGLVEGEYDPEGGPVLRAQYYRHWPRGEYVTTAASGSWRR